ncbi:uncharacterized protein LOC143510301 isoform X2 [Brachyhypopomus gauderio]
MKTTEVKIDKSFFPNPFFNVANTVVKDLPGHNVNPQTMKPKSKWLVKREKEMLKHGTLLKQKGSKCISDPHMVDPNSLPEPSKRPVKESQKTGSRPKLQVQKRHKWTSYTSLATTDITASNFLHRVPCTASFQAETSISKQANDNFLEQIQDVPNVLNKGILVSQVKPQEDVTFLQTKTCVWDHIKNSLYDKRYDFRSAVYSVMVTHKLSGNISASVHFPHVENNQYAVTKSFSTPLVPICQTSVQRPFEDMISLKSQSKIVMGLTPEMATGYCGTLFSSFHSRTSSKVCTKCRSLKPLPQNQGLVTEQRLGDVKLNQLAAWLGTRTPKSRRDAVALFNKGRQWYYKKYIDVQKGGIGGLTMLIAGYCVLSYTWSYSHLKKERWRKYH